MGWIADGGEDSKVLGINKVSIINKIPLLKWYLELFEQALSSDGVRLLIIGYGFEDEHINKLLSKAVETHGLKIYIVSPENAETMHDKLIGKPPRGSSHIWEPDSVGTLIWKGVMGYFPYKLSDIFPISQVPTPASKELKRIFG